MSEFPNSAKILEILGTRCKSRVGFVSMVFPASSCGSYKCLHPHPHLSIIDSLEFQDVPRVSLVSVRALGFLMIFRSLKYFAMFENSTNVEILGDTLYRNTNYFYQHQLLRTVLKWAPHYLWKNENPRIVYQSCLDYSTIIESTRRTSVSGDCYVSKFSSGFAYFLLTFAPGSVLALYRVVLGAEFDSLSNAVVSYRDCRGQSGCSHWNTVSLNF